MSLILTGRVIEMGDVSNYVFIAWKAGVEWAGCDVFYVVCKCVMTCIVFTGFTLDSGRLKAGWTGGQTHFAAGAWCRHRRWEREMDKCFSQYCDETKDEWSVLVSVRDVTPLHQPHLLKTKLIRNHLVQTNSCVCKRLNRAQLNLCGLPDLSHATGTSAIDNRRWWALHCKFMSWFIHILIFLWS